MKYLPWNIAKTNSSLVLDCNGCVTVDLSKWHSVGQGHDSAEIAQFIVRCANNSLEKQEDEEEQKAEKTIGSYDPREE
jgi:hypothetical protein